MEKTYKINRIFFSLQGEGARVGTPMVFVRFSGCNLKCPFCDTDHASSYMEMTAKQIVGLCQTVGNGCRNVSLCGGEPTLQLDCFLIAEFKRWGWTIGVETNGLLPVPDGVDYVVCSPKTPTIAPDHIDELRYVVKAGDPLPQPCKPAKLYYPSPCFDGDNAVEENIKHAIMLVQQNPTWRLGMQWHKFIGIE